MPIRLLIADDHAVFRGGLRVLLEREKDFQIIGEAADGLAAIKLVNESKADMLILDLNMPGISGTQAAEEILKERPKFPVIVLTMHEDQFYLRELFRIGAKGFVLKKSTGSELIKAIRTVYGGEPYVDPALGGRLISSYAGHRIKPGKKAWEMLTPREREVFLLLVYGHTSPEVAEKLSITDRTVETHRANIMAKLELRTRAELVQFAIGRGLFKPA